MCTENLNPDIVMMKSAKDRVLGYDFRSAETGRQEREFTDNDRCVLMSCRMLARAKPPDCIPFAGVDREVRGLKVPSPFLPIVVTPPDIWAYPAAVSNHSRS